MESRTDDRSRVDRQVRRRNAGTARGHDYGPFRRSSNGPFRFSDRRRRPGLVLAGHRSGHVLPGVSASGDRLQHWRIYAVDGSGKRLDADPPGRSRRDCHRGSSAAGFAAPLAAWGFCLTGGGPPSSSLPLSPCSQGWRCTESFPGGRRFRPTGLPRLSADRRGPGPPGTSPGERR